MPSLIAFAAVPYSSHWQTSISNTRQLKTDAKAGFANRSLEAGERSMVTFRPEFFSGYKAAARNTTALKSDI